MSAIDTRIFRHFPSVLIAVVMILPLVYLVSHAVDIDPHVWSRILSRRVPRLLINSLLLLLVVTFGTVVLGTALAVLVERTNLPFRNILRPLLIAPLIVPCYIIALCYINFFGIKGVGEKMFSALGMNLTLPSIYGFWGAAFILILGAYPYVYTIVGASISRLDPTLNEAARTLGKNRLERFFSVTVPLLIPAYCSGRSWSRCMFYPISAW